VPVGVHFADELSSILCYFLQLSLLIYYTLLNTIFVDVTTVTFILCTVLDSKSFLKRTNYLCVG